MGTLPSEQQPDKTVQQPVAQPNFGKVDLRLSHIATLALGGSAVLAIEGVAIGRWVLGLTLIGFVYVLLPPIRRLIAWFQSVEE